MMMDLSEEPEKAVPPIEVRFCGNLMDTSFLMFWKAEAAMELVRARSRSMDCRFSLLMSCFI